MRSEIFKHKLAYGLLLVAILTFTLGFFAVWPNRIHQRILIVIFSVFYFLWGVMTHVKSRKFTNKVLSEYLATSLLVGVLLFLITI